MDAAFTKDGSPECASDLRADADLHGTHSHLPSQEHRKAARARFDYLTKLFRNDNRDALQNYLSGSLGGPVVVDFDPTTACNFTCPECISADLLNKEKIPGRRIEELMKEFAIAGVKGIVFIGGGEPLAHSCMPHPIRLAHELGMQVGLTTNGSLIDRYRNAIAECVSWTRVSMDAGTPETFLVFRPNKIPDSFNKIVRAMAKLAERKKGALGYSFLMMTRTEGGKLVTNVHEIYTAARLAKTIGCDYFEVKPMFDMGHNLIPFLPELTSAIRDQIGLCKELQTDTFDIVTTRSIDHIRSQKNPNQVKDYRRCPTMELRTTVTPSGTYPCAYHRGRTDKRLGTVDDGPFNEFWTSSQRKAAAERTDPRRDCGFYCARHQVNKVMLALEDMHGEGIDLLRHIKSEDIDDTFF